MPQNAWTGLSQATANLPALGMGMVKMQRDEQNKATAIGIAQERNRIAQEHYGVMEANAARQTAAAEAKVPPHLRIANPSGLAPAKLATQKAFGKAGMDALDPVWGLYKDISEKNPGTTMSDVYAAAKSAYPSMREEIAANIQKSLESGKLSPNEQKRMSALYDAVMYDQTGDKVLGEGIFKNTARSIKMEEENSKAAQTAAREEGKNTRAEMMDARIRELAEENMALKRDREARLSDKGGGKEKEPKKPTPVDMARLRKMIADAGNEPSADDITLINEAAGAMGYDYVPYEEPGTLRGIPGTSIADFRTGGKKGYKLVKKEGGAYQSADEVKAAYQAGKIDEATATQILQKQFGYK